MRRRTFATASVATGLLSALRLSHSKEVRVVYVYAGAGGIGDTVARAMQETLSRNAKLDMQLVVENRPVFAGDAFKQTRGGSLHVLTGETLRRLQLDTPYQYKDYFIPLVSLGRDVSVLLVSPRMGAKTLDDLRRVRGKVRVASPVSTLANRGPLKQLAAPIVAPQLLPDARIEYVDVRSFLFALRDNDVDLVVSSLDQVPRMPGAAALMASRSFQADGLGWPMASLARYIGSLPVEDEFLVCCDKGWSPGDTKRISNALAQEYPAIRTSLRSRLPGLQPSSLKAAEAQEYLGTYFHGRSMATFSPQFYLECGKAFPCEPLRLDQRVSATLSANRAGVTSLPSCGPVIGKTPEPGPGQPDLPPCISTVAMGSNKPPVEDPPKPEEPEKKPLSWFAEQFKLDEERIKAAAKDDIKKLDEAEKKLYGPDEDLKMLEAAEKKMFGPADDSKPAPKKPPIKTPTNQ